MNKKALVLIVIFSMLILFFCGCTEKVIIDTGRIEYIDLEGGFFGIITEDGTKYDPTNLPGEFRINGLEISFKGRVLKDQGSFHMWGTPIYLLEIEEKKDARGSLTNHTGCKETYTDDADPTKDCLKYEYDGQSTLIIKHINAGFNCCPEITANITITNDEIIIKEIELFGECDCLCLFDLDYEIIYLDPGTYRILVIEPYRHEDDEKLEFTVDLISEPSGIYCVNRTYYPWI